MAAQCKLAKSTAGSATLADVAGKLKRQPPTEFPSPFNPTEPSFLASGSQSWASSRKSRSADLTQVDRGPDK
jgi:hypothetical protein